MNQKPSAAQQVQSVTAQLTKALATKCELLEKLDQLNSQIAGLRNAVNGVMLGQRLEQEVIAEREANAAKEKATVKAYSEAAENPDPARTIVPIKPE